MPWVERGNTLSSAEQRPGNAGIGIGIAPTQHGRYHGCIHIISGCQMAERILQSDHHPAHMMLILARQLALARSGDALPDGLACLVLAKHLQRVGDHFLDCTAPNTSSYRCRVRRVGLNTNRVGMGDRSILRCPSGGEIWVTCRRHTNWRNTHQGAVGLAIA